MEDFQVIVFILLGIAYFLFMGWRKAFQGFSDQSHAGEKYYDPEKKSSLPKVPGASAKKNMEELQPVKQATKAAAKKFIAKAPETPFVSKQAKSYEDVIPKALSWEKRAEAIEAAKNSKKFRQGSFDAYEQRPVRQQRIVSALKNPASLRDAFVLSEVLKRKF